MSMNKDDVKKVAVIGAGTMGHGMAQSFAAAGIPVSLMARRTQSLERASELIKASLDTMARADFIDKGRIPEILSRIRYTNSLEEAAQDADLAFETVAEDKQAKIDTFARLDELCPRHALLASNTTFMNIFDFVKTSRPDKVLIAHFYSPPQIIPLVDIVRGPQTDPASVQWMAEVIRGIGKKPVVFNRMVSGYVVSRLQFAFQREVLWLLDNDYVSPEELDDAAKWGLAMRMMIVGVVQRFDFGGLDLSARNLAKPSFPPTPIEYMPKKIFELVKQGHLGVKTGKGFYDYTGKTEAEVCAARDMKLLKLLKFLEELL
ncbi:MAG: mmgB 1 [Acidobacteria bacterium]|nr:mmgB 1 [Acidobacteriota bacterium]